MKKFRVFLFLVFVTFGFGVGECKAGLVLTFTPSATSIGVGQTVDVDVHVVQTDPAIPGADIRTNGIFQADIRLTLDNTNATATGFAVGTGYVDEAFFGSDISDPLSPFLSVESVVFEGVTAPAGSPTSIHFGTFTFTGNSVGTTLATPVDTSSFVDINFNTDPGDIDADIFGSGFSIEVTAVPEPSSFALASLLACAWGVSRRRRSLAG